jgi:type IV pilus modification protein PilV
MKGKKDRRTSWSQHEQQGFSMLEVLVAILLLTVGLLALAKMQTHAVASNSFGSQLTAATFLAQDKVEELRLLNECYLGVIATPQVNWTADDQAVVTNYNNQLSDVVDNWTETDTDSDGIPDQFQWVVGSADHTNADGPEGVANPIDAKKEATLTGGYTRTWYLVDDRPTVKAKTVRVRVTWGYGTIHEVTMDTVLSQ